MIQTPWYRRSTFRSLWKSVAGFVTGALTGATTWKDAGIASGVALVASSWDLLFGEDSYREDPS